MAKASKAKVVEKGVDMSNKDSKQEAFEEAVLSAKQKYGDGAIQKIDDSLISEEEKLEEVISTGILQVDRATKRGGFVKGSIVEIYGLESSGKTTLCLHTIATVLKNGGNAIYIDMEHALQKDHINNCGIKELHISQPTTAEEALDEVAMFSNAGTDLIVVDSVAALVPKDEVEAEMGKQFMGLQARIMSQALRKLTGMAKKNRSTIIFINQIRHKIGVVFGSPEVTSGGNALKFYASIRLNMRRGEQIKMGNETVANQIKVKVPKNKTGAPYAEEAFHMFFDAKRTIAANVLEFGSQLGIIDKAGSWYSYNDEKIGQGLANSVNYLVESKPELIEELFKKCRDNLFTPVVSISNMI